MRYLLLFVCLIGAATHAEDTRSIVVTGRSEVMTVPDLAVLRFAVEARAQRVTDARQRVDATVAGVVRLMRELQVPAEDLATAALVVQPEYQWQQDTRQQVLLGYIVTRRMSVRLSETGRLGAALEGILELGVNRVEPPSFDSSERDALELRGLADAARDARRRADALAQAVGASVGDVRHLNTEGAPRIYAATEQAARAVTADASPGYQPGQIVITSQVTATFDLIAD